LGLKALYSKICAALAAAIFLVPFCASGAAFAASPVSASSASASPAGIAAQVHTNPLNLDPLVKEAFDRFYELDYSGAVSRFERFHDQHPGDPQATALLLDAVLFQELYRLDLLDTTFYSNDGFLSGKHATVEDPKTRDRIFALADEAIHEADWRLSKDPNDIDALYARGWARSLKCTYIAMVQRSFAGGLKLAIKAKDDHEHVLQLDPNYVDAKLVVGVYEYVVGALPTPFKLIIGIAGITGSRSTGLAMLADASNRGIVSTVEARTTSALFLRREGRYNDALAVIRTLRVQYPRDFLFCIEEAALRKEAGDAAGAAESYREILRNSDQPGYFPSARVELARFGLGDALRGQHLWKDAAESYEKAALTPEAGPELKIRSMLAAGECRDLNSERQQALRDYQMAVDAGPDTTRADTARKYLRSPYRGKD
jgi:tetratricopeptide (TPR) repeat protein